jgi:hypothetical protein
MPDKSALNVTPEDKAQAFAMSDRLSRYTMAASEGEDKTTLENVSTILRNWASDRRPLANDRIRNLAMRGRSRKTGRSRQQQRKTRRYRK